MVTLLKVIVSTVSFVLISVTVAFLSKSASKVLNKFFTKIFPLRADEKRLYESAISEYLKNKKFYDKYGRFEKTIFAIFTLLGWYFLIFLNISIQCRSWLQIVDGRYMCASGEPAPSISSVYIILSFLFNIVPAASLANTTTCILFKLKNKNKNSAVLFYTSSIINPYMVTTQFKKIKMSLKKYYIYNILFFSTALIVLFII